MLSGMRPKPPTRAPRSQARRPGDFDVANPKWWYEIFDATGSFRFAGVLRARRAVRRAPRDESWRSKG
jgi:hypothetical protein